MSHERSYHCGMAVVVSQGGDEHPFVCSEVSSLSPVSTMSSE